MPLPFFGKGFEVDDDPSNVIPLQEVDSGDDFEIPSELPILPLRGVVVYPMMWLPLTVGQARSIRLVDDALVENRVIGLFTSKSPEVEEPNGDQIYDIGTAAIVHRMVKVPDGNIRLIVQGMERVRVVEYVQNDPYLKARVEGIPEVLEESVELEALSRNTQELFRRFISLAPHMPDELQTAALNVEDARQLTYLVSSSLRLNLEDAQRILEIDNVQEKLTFLNTLLTRELEVLELGRELQSKAQGEMEKTQREYFLREQLKAIQKELGEDDEQTAEVKELEERIASANMTEEAEKEARRELDRMRKMPPQAAEYSVIKTYLDWLASLPWQIATEDHLDISHARQVLDEDHYGLEEVKERILEFLAVRKLRTERKENQDNEEEGEVSHDYIRREREGIILCFVGPPGVGKTSLGLSIARAMGRKFIRMSLGGIRDEADIRGFRRTYIGSMPGRIIQMIRRSESRNPVIMLDEVDKLGRDFRGDPASALLEVLDPEQNVEFRDHYLDVAFDLSQVFFITTANMLEPIPGPLRDRMEILDLSSYTDEDKINIAKGYLIPRQIRENALRSREIEFEDEAVYRIIREYTREAGVRNLERQIGAICRKLATRIAEGQTEKTVIAVDDVPSYLGKRKYYLEVAERVQRAGVATGLVVTPVGGDIIFIESTRVVGSKGFTVTGQLGEVMKESAQAALSYIRSKAKDLGIDESFFDKSDLHLHVPAGAVPKDGPSAGVTMATALASLLTDRSVRPDIAMTGEITLRGQVLPVGGIKEKVLAAHRAGLRTVILPQRNEVDLDDLPQDVREELNYILVEQVDQVLAAALSEPSEDGHENLDGAEGKKKKASKRKDKKTETEAGLVPS